MRLEKIKLAGFKSFVDPTTVLFPSNLVGVVGPNGCGKSNVIDAVRWVMGESSAKMLRGESMADVIFNGSTSRKPVGLASIELIFDNGDGGAGGEYARFNQISVKRQVSRDGQSGYFLNGSRCRRRDIQDLFLGTGLGPRSYAIIEQGMISRIIEARPEDLRLFIEEAAGISKYKERRKETETRMRATRENLERLEDLREEVSKQLLHLERQADTAARYTELKAEERRLDLELKALRWRALDDELAGLDRQLSRLETAQAATLAQQRRVEADLEAHRESQGVASGRFNQIQGHFYAVGSEIARAEQAIQFANESRGRREAELVRLDQDRSEIRHHLDRDQARLAELGAELVRDEPLLAQAQAELSEAIATVMTAEGALRDWESEWDGFNREANRPSEQALVERTRINQLEQRLGRDHERLRRIAEEAARLDGAAGEQPIEALELRAGAIESRLAEAESRRQTLEGTLAGQETAIRGLGSTLDRIRTGLQQAKGRRASLAALQEEALGDRDRGRTEWLERHGLTEAPRLAERIRVAADWERATETLLADALGAIPVANLESLAEQGLQPGLVLIDTQTPGRPGPPAPSRLSALVQAPWPLDDLLGAVGTAEDATEALGRRAELGPGERLIARDGTLVGRNWLRTPEGRGAARGGVLERAKAIEDLDARLASLSGEEGARTAELEALRDARAETLREREEADRTLTTLNRELATVRAELTGLRARQENLRERHEALTQEQVELSAQCADALTEMEESRERLNDLLEVVDRLAERRELLSAEREDLRGALARGRESERRCRAATEDLRVKVESNRAARDATQGSLARLQGQQVQLDEHRDELMGALEESVEPLAEQRARLDEQLILRVEVEEELAGARRHLNELDAQIRDLEQARHRLEQESRQAQATLDQVRLGRQERLVRRRTLEEQVAESDCTIAAILEGLDPAAEEDAWQERLTRVGTRIQRLGAINLAAIDEYQEQKRRKVYLDEQHGDIARALETLEAAIRKIDRETRGRFKDTYDQVNHGVQQLFPRLFGGGHAYLELTGEDLLETGVSVMARPPGKRNSSIHLLSGGEKALTAVALVFAIFQLNPAPFCMLDEVDAPLDDANVGRFCELVRSMSDKVQFVFISHNKVTMEIADHLLGVTMHEPGVSRLVSVDVEEAARLAAVS